MGDLIVGPRMLLPARKENMMPEASNALGDGQGFGKSGLSNKMSPRVVLPAPTGVCVCAKGVVNVAFEASVWAQQVW